MNVDLVSNKPSVTVLGDGSWGTAVATILANNGYQVLIWCYNPQIAQTINSQHLNNHYLPGITLHENIHATTDFAYALQQSSIIFEAVPVKFLRTILTQAQSHAHAQHTWVVLSKGIEQQTLLVPTQIIDDVIGQGTKVVFSGPSFAHDVVRKHMTAAVVASHDQQAAQQIQRMVRNDYILPVISDDVMGVQVSSAIKNVVALGMGLLDGAGYTDNTKALFITRGLQELSHLVHAVGGHQETVYGYAGVGDLILTCMGNHSRNVAVGRKLARGSTIASFEQETGSIPEGITTAAAIYQLSKKLNLALPLCTGVYRVVHERVSVDQMLREIAAL